MADPTAGQIEDDDGLASARLIVPHILRSFAPRSVVDIGCGRGSWLAAFAEQGLDDYMGVDRKPDDLGRLRIQPAAFAPADLAVPFAFERGFDLALCLEVADSLPAGRAGKFVECLAALAPVVLFSAAIPGQPGEGRLNAQWPPYWVALFARHGFRAMDWLRPLVWHDPRIAYRYAQNMLVFLRQDAVERLPWTAERLVDNPDSLSLVHPRCFIETTSALSAALEEEEQRGREAIDRILSRRHRLAEELLGFADAEALQASPVYADYLGLLSKGDPAPRSRYDEHLCRSLVERLAGIVSDGAGQNEAGLIRLVLLLFYAPHSQPVTLRLGDLPRGVRPDILKVLLKGPEVFREPGEAERFAEHFHALTEAIPLLPDSARLTAAFATSVTLAPLYFTTRNLKPTMLNVGTLYRRHVRSLGYRLDHSFPPRRPGRIRLGVLARHYLPQTETFTALPVYAHLDPEIFEVVLFSHARTGQAMEQVCADTASELVFLPKAISEAIEVIRGRDLDILLFASNLTYHLNPLTVMALHRMARVQVTGFSSPVTTGLSSIDYYLSGELSESANAQDQYAEPLALLPGTGFCFDYGRTPPLPARAVDRDELRIAKDTVVFASGANMLKILPELRAWWGEILARIPEAVLVLMPFSPTWLSAYPEEEFSDMIRNDIAAAGGRRDQVRIIKGLANREMVKALLRNADVYLDSAPYSGANSTVDPLELAIPVVTCGGGTIRTQQAGAILQDLGLGDQVTRDRQGYVELAVRLGTDPAYRALVSARIAAAMAAGPAFLDTRAYCALTARFFEMVAGVDDPGGSSECVSPSA